MHALASIRESRPGRRQVVPAERRRRILELLRGRGSVSVAALQDMFGVSPVTARRDLAILAQEGRAVRTHGGAVLPEFPAAHENSFDNRYEREVSEKHRLATAVVETVRPRETVFIDSSSSSYYVVREILDRGLTVTLLTNSLPAMSLVGSSDSRNVELVGLGGNFLELTRSFVGPETVRAIHSFAVDRFIFSVKGIDAEGFLTDPDPLEAEVKRAMISRARQSILLATPTKFEKRGLSVIVLSHNVDTSYLADPPPEGARALEAAGVAVHTV
jgi:DeoR/GlpR family transcriptional regulator of sugar metabolism